MSHFGKNSCGFRFRLDSGRGLETGKRFRIPLLCFAPALGSPGIFGYNVRLKKWKGFYCRRIMYPLGHFLPPLCSLLFYFSRIFFYVLHIVWGPNYYQSMRNRLTKIESCSENDYDAVQNAQSGQKPLLQKTNHNCLHVVLGGGGRGSWPLWTDFLNVKAAILNICSIANMCSNSNFISELHTSQQQCRDAGSGRGTLVRSRGSGVVF